MSVLRVGKGEALHLAGVVAATLLCPLALVALTTGLLSLAVKYAELEFDLVVYLIPVVVCAVRWGRVAAILAVCASAAVADYLFIAPVHTFVIDDFRQGVELAAFVFVALVTGHLAGRLRRHGETLLRRDDEIRNLYEFSRQLASSTTGGELLTAIEGHLSAHLRCEVRLIGLAAFPRPREGERDEGVPQAVAGAVARVVRARRQGPCAVIDPETDTLWVLKYLATGVAGNGVLAINLGSAAGRSIDPQHGDGALSQATAMLTRIDAAAVLAKIAARLESEVLHAALINTAAHELRSPVAAILGSASVLDQAPALRADAKLRALVEGMHHEAERLHGDIENLLNTVRITDTQMRLHRQWSDPADILGVAIRQRMRRTTHKLVVDIDRDLPLVHVDPVLVEQAVGQVIDNAAKYSPESLEIAITARIEDDQFVVSVTDAGVGLTQEEADNLFRRAWRGRRHVGNVPGLGLGLWIARTFVEAHGGTVRAHSPGPELGTTVSIRLPLPPASAVRPFTGQRTVAL